MQTVGDKFRVNASFTDDANVAVDPTTVTFKVKKPDGTQTSYVYPAAEVVKESTGKYYSIVNFNVSGVWFTRWEGSSSDSAVAKETKWDVQVSHFT